MKICISTLRGTKIMEYKAPNLEGLLLTLAYLRGALSPSCTTHGLLMVHERGHERCKEKDRTPLGVEDR